MKFRLKRGTILALSMLLAFTSCETEVDLFTDGDPVPVVFALLEPQNTTQYFRINPTFKGEGDARELAGNASITNYAEGEIEVKLIHVKIDGTVEEYVCKDTTGIPLNDDGIFSTQNRLYYLNTPVSSGNNGLENEILLPGETYRLEITHTKTGAVSTSEIVLGDYNRIRPISPKPNPSNFLERMKFYTGTNYNKPYTFEYDADALSERFMLEMTYYYTDSVKSSSDQQYWRDSSTTFVIGEVNSIDVTDGFKKVDIDFDGEKFYSILASQLPESIKRNGTISDLTFTAVGPDLDIYLSVQDASLTSIAGETPSYTNIENGLGVFSYRFVVTDEHFLMDDNSARQLIRSDYTRDRFACAVYGSSPSEAITCDK